MVHVISNSFLKALENFRSTLHPRPRIQKSDPCVSLDPVAVGGFTGTTFLEDVGNRRTKEGNKLHRVLDLANGCVTKLLNSKH